MSDFNFEIKNQSYKLVLEKTKEFLQNDDIENGLIYLHKAIQLCSELMNNCIIVELKQTYIEEYKKLKYISSELSNNRNPFIKKTENKIDTSLVQNENNYSFFQTTPPNVTLKDVAGLEDVKKEIILNVLTPLKYPELYFQYKDKLGCQILMYGPPGCGKSFVAEAIAGELKCAYAIINAHDILDKYVGEAPKKIAQIMQEAEQYDKCLIFFDELDILFSSREADDSKYTKEILTTFLTCLSGFQSNKNSNKIRIIIGATNRPWILDSALLRGKRFDTHLYVPLPDKEARKFIISKVYSKHPKLLINSDVTISQLVNLFDGYSVADIESILDKVNSRALFRALENKENKTNKPENVILNDYETVMKSYRNSVTKEILEAYEAFKKGDI